MMLQVKLLQNSVIDFFSKLEAMQNHNALFIRRIGEIVKNKIIFKSTQL